MAHGFWNGSLGSFEFFAQNAVNRGYTWAALQLDDRWENAVRWPGFRDALLEVGVQPGVWFTDPWSFVSLYSLPPDADFAIFEDESANDRDGIVHALDHLPSGPRYAVITDAWVYKLPDGVTTDVPRSRESTAPIVEAGLTCLTEVYARTDGGQPTGKTVENMEFVAREHLGYRDVQPCYGVFGGARLQDYDTSRAQFSVWLAESEGVLS